jgi:hypothetical protein
MVENDVTGEFFKFLISCIFQQKIMPVTWPSFLVKKYTEATAHQLLRRCVTNQTQPNLTQLNVNDAYLPHSKLTTFVLNFLATEWMDGY